MRSGRTLFEELTSVSVVGTRQAEDLTDYLIPRGEGVRLARRNIFIQRGLVFSGHLKVMITRGTKVTFVSARAEADGVQVCVGSTRLNGSSPVFPAQLTTLILAVAEGKFSAPAA